MYDDLRISKSDRDWNPQYFGVVAGLFCGLCVITGALNSKIFEFYGFFLPAGIILFPLCTILSDIMTEIYGFNRTRQAIWTVLVVTIIYGVSTTIVTYFTPAPFWQNQAAYEAIFATSWRIALAGCLAWLAGEFSNSFIMAKMKIFQNAENMSVRFIGSTVVGQFFDTVVYACVAFAGTMPLADFLKLVVVVWIAKVAYEVVALPLSTSCAKWLKRREGVEHFDHQKLSVI